MLVLSSTKADDSILDNPGNLARFRSWLAAELWTAAAPHASPIV
jgi:hypothetical protein